MGHNVAGFVARWRAVEPAEIVADGAAIAPLNDGYGLLVLDDSAGGVPDALDEPIAKLGLALSIHNGAVAFVVTDYFGGVGEQGGAAWRDGVLVMPYEVSRLGSINSALGAIGVTRRRTMTTLAAAFGGAGVQKHDLFDTVGLGRYRDNSDWLACAESEGNGLRM